MGRIPSNRPLDVKPGVHFRTNLSHFSFFRYFLLGSSPQKFGAKTQSSGLLYLEDLWGNSAKEIIKTKQLHDSEVTLIALNQNGHTYCLPFGYRQFFPSSAHSAFPALSGHAVLHLYTSFNHNGQRSKASARECIVALLLDNWALSTKLHLLIKERYCAIHFVQSHPQVKILLKGQTGKDAFNFCFSSPVFLGL